ncbi:MAG TPA: aspartate aminotransferase family protein [Actinomycetota bacterium]|nr:aspartate aminotransferase family protein [Actinomycetota bacterium]
MGSIKIVTDVPGPRSSALAAAAPAWVARPVAPDPTSVAIARGEGAMVEDVDGNRYLDLTGGLGCLAVGHSHPKVVDAIREQATRFLHTDYSVIPYDLYQRLAEAVSQHCGGGRKVAFFNSGAEAIENAVKIARAVTGRPGIICFEGAFHGRTNLTLALTQREVPYKQGFGPFTPEVYRLPYPGFEGATMESFEKAAREVFAAHDIAAAVVEPQLGEGGFVVPPPEFLPLLKWFTKEFGALLVVDEIQTGYGRTGMFLASERRAVRPDLVALGKSIASGLPLSAVAGEPDLMDALNPGTLGGTYVGNPVALAAGIAVLEVIDEGNLVERAKRLGELITTGWTAIASAAPGLIGDIRGLGSMVGVEFRDREVLARLRATAMQLGVLTVTAGKEAKVLRHLIPLVITDDELAEAFAVFNEAAAAAAVAAV